MVSSVADEDDAFSQDDGTSRDLEKTFFEYLEISVKPRVYCVSSTRYEQFFKITVNRIYKESIWELESRIQHLLENNNLQIDLASIETESLKHCGLNSDINCVGALTILSSCILYSKKTDETTKVSILTVPDNLQEVILSLFGRNASTLECFICRNNRLWTRSTASGSRSICKRDWSFQRSLFSTRVLSLLRGATMDVICNRHPEENSSDGEHLLNLHRKLSSCTLCCRLGCRIPSVIMTDAVTSSQRQDCLNSLFKESSTLLPVSDGHVRRPSLTQTWKTSQEDHHPMQNIINHYSHCKNNNMNACISTSCQSSSHNQFIRSPIVVSANSSHQRNRKCNVRRSNNSNYVSNCSRSVIVDNNRTSSKDSTASSLICCRSMPVFEDNYCLPSPQTTKTNPVLQPRRWSLRLRSKSSSPSEGVLPSSWCPNPSRTHQSPSLVEHCDDTSLSSSSFTSLCYSSERLIQKNSSRRRRTRSHRTQSLDHSTDPNSEKTSREFRRDGGHHGLESCIADLNTKAVDMATNFSTSLLPVPFTDCDSSSTEGSSSFRVPMDSSVTSLDDYFTAPDSGSVSKSSPRHQVPIPHYGQLHQTSSSPASPVSSRPMSSADSNATQLRQRRALLSVDQQEEMVTQRSLMRHRTIFNRSLKIHPLLRLWNLLTLSSSCSSAFRRDGRTYVKMSQVWTCLLSLMLVITALPNVAECCSSRSTPRPRPSSPTLRPNITFQTYACPPAYAAWYCLNGATCFTVKIGESILYNCECADGYMGQRCEFKDLDGSYLPTREKVLLETASIAGGATVVIVLVFFVIFSVFLVRNRDKETRDLEGFSHINININSGAASSWPANGGGGHQSHAYSQRTSHTFVTSPTGALATSPHTTTISSPPNHIQPGQGCNHHHRHHHDPQQGCRAASVPTESVVDGKCFVSELSGGGSGGTMVVDGGMNGSCITPAATTITAEEAIYGVPARVVRTVTTITDLASIYTNPRQEVHQVEVLQQVNVLKVDQRKACYNATFVRPSSKASTTALFRGPMWQETSHSPDDKVSSAPLSWQQFKATSWLSSSPSKTQDRLSVMPHNNSSASDQAALDVVPQVSHVVVPFSVQRTRLAHSAVTIALASHAAELDGREQLQPSSKTLILANSKMPSNLDSELNSRLSVDETYASTSVYIIGNNRCAMEQSRANDINTEHCTVDDTKGSSSSDAECSLATGAVNQAFDCGEENIVNRLYLGDYDCDKSSCVNGHAPPLLFGAKKHEQY